MLRFRLAPHLSLLVACLRTGALARSIWLRGLFAISDASSNLGPTFDRYGEQWSTSVILQYPQGGALGGCWRRMARAPRLRLSEAQTESETLLTCLRLVLDCLGDGPRMSQTFKCDTIREVVSLDGVQASGGGESKKGYDVVVIGGNGTRRAGLGGLACAAALGKAHSFKRKAPGGGWGMLTPEGPWRLQLGTSNFRDTVLPRYGVPPEEFDEVLKASAPLAQIGRQIPGLVLRDDEPCARWQLLPLLLKAHGHKDARFRVLMKSPDPQFPGAVLPAIREAASLSVLDQLEAEGKMRKGSWLRAWLDALAFSLSGLDCSGLDPKMPGTTTAAMAFTVDELHWEGTRGLAYPKVQEGHRPSDVLGRNYMFFHDVSLRFEKKMSDLNALELGSRLCVSRQGGMGSVIDALAAAVRREGGEIRTNVRVEEAVVCNASVWDAANLLPKEDALEEMREATPQTRSYLHLHLGLDATGAARAEGEGSDGTVEGNSVQLAMASWDDVTAEQNMAAHGGITAAASCRGACHMSQAVVIRNTFLEVGDQEHERSECFRRQVSEPVKIFSSSPKHGDGEDSDEDFAAASKTGGLRAAGAPENL
ncbi:hypothetical protein AK812_SmicGene39697 [Symbiodinium microadriaticum]|uniref:Uncharacterized protein n=1 Tax=Symbiodinium microadriaticum TaxID=2951 RepID=A0A1Q9CAJ2_SYMMI|nr:hypothetical protein AK812_SmicGene39697 [Symbiodinium microadriaticum]